MGKIDQDRRFDGFHRNWLNIIQMNPRFRGLANNSTSDTAALCYYEYADIARHTPPLAEGLTALDLVRQSLDRVLGRHAGLRHAGLRYGRRGADANYPQPTLDTYPAMLIAAREYVAGQRQPGLAQGELRRPEGLDREDAGHGPRRQRPDRVPRAAATPARWRPKDAKCRRQSGNWWDTIGFGHEDAYSNALGLPCPARHGGTVWTRWARPRMPPATAPPPKSSATPISRPSTIRPPACWPAGGAPTAQLHDYWFLWVNGAAIHYGLVPKDKANAIMDRLMAKIKEVGFTRFDLGLPGNLVPVPMKDYRELRARFGGGTKEDGSEGFQHYENGGATACFAYFTLAALYDLGRPRRSRPNAAADAGRLRPQRFRGPRPCDQPVEGLEILGRRSLRLRGLLGRQLLRPVGGAGSGGQAASAVRVECQELAS